MAPVIGVLGESLEDVFPGEDPVVGGAPLNVACHLRGFGAHPLLVTRIGNDAGGERLMNFFQAQRLSDAAIQRDPLHASGRVDVRAEGSVNVFEIPIPQAWDFLDAGAAAAAVVEASPSAVYYGTLAQRHEASRAAVRRCVHATAAARFCDLNLRPPWTCDEVIRVSLGCAQVLKLSGEELAEVVERLGIPVTRDAAHELMEAYPLRTLAVTEGENGARRLDREGRGVVERRENAHPPARFVDSVGAGDAFSAVTLLGHVLGWGASEALARASDFAGAICGIRGAVPRDAGFYSSFRREWELAA